MTTADRCVIALSFAALVPLYVQLWGRDTQPQEARVTVDGQEVLRVSLFENHRYDVKGPAGVTVVEVADGRVRCVSSPGPRHLCERAGWLSASGDSAVNLPNRVSIEVLGRDQRFDSVSY